MRPLHKSSGDHAVCLDAQIFAFQKRGGISRYFVELLKERSAFGDHGLDLVLGFSRANCDQLLQEFPGRFRQLSGIASRRTRLMAASALWPLPAKADLIHHTYYDPLYLRPTRARRVSTVHDMMPELFPKWFPQKNPHMAKKKYVAVSDLIFAVSATTKQDLCNVFGVPEERVRVTHLAADPMFCPAPSSSLMGTGRPYFLYVGPRAGYKNHSVLANALGRLRQKPECDIDLICVGGGAPTPYELVQWKKFAVAERIKVRSASDVELVDLYRGALACVVPSLYEGFGLPALEAMQSGCPVIVSTGGSLPEVVSDAGWLFEPGDVAQLESLLRDCIVRDAARESLRRSGLERARQFSWGATAAATAKGYKDLLS